jgi:hypothetical protein
MKKYLLITMTLISLNAQALDKAKYFARPLNCPLRFSSLSTFRDQVQTLVASLGKGCTQNGQQAINQLNSNVSSLEGFANSYNTYNSATNSSASAQYAKNVGQVLGSINLITSNNACFYDIKSRGFLPVLADVVMSASQLGLLIPSAAGAAVAAGGYVAGSGLKIVNELMKKKFNFEKPEESRAFMQLNCAFFDNRRVMEESGIFNPETENYREELVTQLRRERIDILKSQKKNEAAMEELEETLINAIDSISSAQGRGLNPSLARKMDEVLTALARRPNDYSEKLRQVSLLSEKAKDILEGVKVLDLSPKMEKSRKLLILTLEKIIPDLEPNAKSWTNVIDDYEMYTRGPLFAFLVPVSDALKKELMTVEAELAIADPVVSKKISRLRLEIKQNQSSAWSLGLRLTSLETKINSFERLPTENLFSDNDEGSSNAVEILDYYRKLQSSILGTEGRDYLKYSIRMGFSMKDGLDRQIKLLDSAQTQKEKCAAAEKTRFAWAQYRYKVQESYDFVATNLDLYRSSFRIGKERQKRATFYVLEQMDSVQDFQDGRKPLLESVGDLMSDVSGRVKIVETKLQQSGCF